MSNELSRDGLAAALGASSVVSVSDGTVGGPLDMLALRNAVSSRFRSTGGRPSDPAWTMSRQIPFKKRNWTRLQDIANELGIGASKKVGPGQLAAILVERGLDDLEIREWRQILAISRRQPPLRGADAAELAGVKFRDFDEWRRSGIIEAVRSEGRLRWFDDDSIVRAVVLRRLLPDAEMSEKVKRSIRDADLRNRYLVVTERGELIGFASARDLADGLSHLETAGVIDQLPVRQRLISESGRKGTHGADHSTTASSNEYESGSSVG